MKIVDIKNISIVIVIYQETYELISNTLNQLKGVRKILIDNGNDIDLKKKLSNKFDFVEYILNKKNVGFSAGYNQGIKLCKTDYCLILGPDCIIKKDAIVHLLKLKEKYNDALIVTPTSYNDKNQLTYAGGPLPEKGSKDQILKIHGDVCVENALGACMLMNIDDIKKYDLFFDENFFLYFSDDDLCRKIKKLNKFIIQSKEATCIHLHGNLKIKNKLRKIFIREYNFTFDHLYYFYKSNKKNNVLAQYEKKFIKYLIKAFLKLIIFQLEDSMAKFATCLAYIKFKIIHK